jgi:hypothetical protein
MQRTVSPHSKVPMPEEVRKRYPKDYFKKKKSLRGQGLEGLKRQGIIGPRGGIRYEKKLKAYRKDKAIPRDAKVTIEQDLGRSKQITTLKARHFTEETRNISKKKNTDLVIVWQYGAYKIKYSPSSGKYYQYVGNFPHDEYDQEIHLGAIYDMIDTISNHIGAITRTIHWIKNGHKYMRLSFLSRATWLRRMKDLGNI